MCFTSKHAHVLPFSVCHICDFMPHQSPHGTHLSQNNYVTFALDSYYKNVPSVTFVTNVTRVTSMICYKYGRIKRGCIVYTFLKHNAFCLRKH